MLREFKNLVAFLTIIPLGMDPHYLGDAANCMYLFPLLGGLIGLLAGSIGWVLIHVLPSLVVGVLTLSFILLVTGLHHTDGLLDFGDGIMYQGSPAKKIEIMHDHNTGAGGLTLGLLTILTAAFCIAGLNKSIIIPGLIASEVAAKLAMVFGASIGKSAGPGLNTYFINAMQGTHRKLRLAAALFISFLLAIPLAPILGLAALISGLVASVVLVGISNRHFRGLTGDVFGATNELVRVASLVSILAVARWA
jgi:adenosylcobinamide-GDP ribazoletransferase